LKLIVPQNSSRESLYQVINRLTLQQYFLMQCKSLLWNSTLIWGTKPWVNLMKQC